MIWVILVTATVLRLISLNQSLWLDEAINVLATRNFSLIGIITDYARFDFHPPGFFIILWIWAKIFGTGEIWVRLPSVIFGILTVYVIFLIGRKIYSKNLGLLAAFLLAINPLHIYYSQEARMYSLATLAVAINVYLFIKLLKNEKVNIFLLTLSNFLILMSDYVAYLIFPALFIILLINKQKQLLKKWLVSFFGAGLISLWWLPVFLSQLTIGTVTAGKLPVWKMVVGGFDIKSVPLTLVKFIIGRISYPDKSIYYLILLPVGLLFLSLLISGFKKTNPLYRKLLTVWLIVPVFLAALISFAVPVYEYFRLLYVLPAFIILLAAGILSFNGQIKYILLGLVVATEVFSSMVYLFNPNYQREDWKGLANFINGQKNAAVLFESSGTFPPFDYYFNNQIPAHGALRNFPAKNSGDIEDLNNIIGDASNVYLVNYLVEISDPGRLVSQTLAGSGYRLKETRNFTGVGFVYHYVK